MRCIAVCALILSVASIAAHADTIGLYNDPQGVECNIIDDDFPLKGVYVIHFTASGSAASQWSAPKPACWTNATWLSDTEPFSMPGNSQVGKSVGYGACIGGPAIHVLTINYYVQGQSPACCQYPLLPDPRISSGEVEVVDCSNQVVFASGEVSTINGDSSCPCGYPVAVEETTWGKVKSLYIE